MRSLGVTITKIAKELGVAKSSVSVWCKGIELSPEQQAKIKRKTIEAQKRDKICVVCGNVFPRKLEIKGKIRNFESRKKCLDCQPFFYGKDVIRNGEYLFVTPPPEFPGRLYRDKFCYEHTYIYWKNTGRIPEPNELIHHENRDKHDNRFENLVIKTRGSHSILHGIEKGNLILLLKCPTCGVKFTRQKRQTNFIKGGLATHCSRRCSSTKDKPYLAENIVGMFRHSGRSATVAQAEGLLQSW